MDKPSALSQNAFRKKVSHFIHNFYEPIADELLAKCLDNGEFDLFHDFTHLCKDALSHDKNPTNKTKLSLQEKYKEFDEGFATKKAGSEYPKLYAAAEELFAAIKTQVELREIPIAKRSI